MKERYKENCRDKEKYPYIFPTNYGAETKLDGYDIEIPENREVVIEITTFISVSIGAMHYYANLKAEGITFRDKETGYSVVDSNIFKYIDSHPESDSSYRIEIIRPLTKQEFDADPYRWQYYHEGSTTNAFRTVEEALDLAIKVCKERFPGWKIVTNIYA